MFIVFGATGMLGSEVVKELHRRGHSVREPDHKSFPIQDRGPIEILLSAYGPDDTIINCAGLIKGDDADMVMVNAVGPQILATVAIMQGIPLLHVSTDCVFKGSPGPHKVIDAPDANEIYGKSKMVGEAMAVHSPQIMIVRTSFIGFRHGLLDWFLTEARAKKSRRIPAWDRALWSGSTVWAVARALVTMAEKWPVGGVHHLATAEPISKADLLEEISLSLGLGAKFQRKSKPLIDRSLMPTTTLPPFRSELVELRERYRALYLPSNVHA